MTDLATTLDAAFRERGLAEVTIRVSRYEADLKTPAVYQAIAKYRDRIGGPWGVGVTTSPSATLRRAVAPAATEGSVFD